ncbi:VanZ family protein [Corynebacterium atrinae]|uniref:VanZ family protein n=1 Tax=Corynebacterium atrinae TaxID=1336740 RepID=UPI0025B41778|nr:VanZ family protein [Corynebacterium atrinae]
MPRPSRSLVVIALAVYLTVMVSLTMLKAFYRIGYLWDPARQRQRTLRLIPFEDIMTAKSWFAPLFGYVGNLGFFIPFGILVYVLVYQVVARPVVTTVLAGLATSLTIEVAQYIFSLGYSDVDDLLMNTLGGFLGAVVARAMGPRFHLLWVWLALILGLVFVVLVGFGERLGDSSKVVNVE